MRLTALLMLAALSGWAQPTDSQRTRNRDLLLRNLLPSRPPTDGRINLLDRSWEDWVKRTGELPPDFDALPSIADLPDPLLAPNGTRIANAEHWQRQKQWIRLQAEQWIFGRMPPAPGNLRSRVVRETREGTVTIRDVQLEFGPGHRGQLRLQLILPPGRGPFPVFLTNHNRNRPWIYTAVNRGYMVCIYHATDPIYGEPDDSEGYLEVYPEYDFSRLGRWAWSAARAVDYLFTIPEANREQIGLAGHSRNGKQALLAAAFDERVGAVVLSSGLTGEALPWRFNSDPYVVESIQLLTGARPHWFHPRLRYFTGREHKLPIDQNSLMALVAPRGLMIVSGYAEASSNPLGLEQAYRSAREVFRFLGKPENIWLNLREGEHATSPGDVEIFFDFYDTVFGRRTLPRLETWIVGYDFDHWKQVTGIGVDLRQYPARKPGDFVPASLPAWERSKAEIRERLRWILGDTPPQVPQPPRKRLRAGATTADGWLSYMYGRPGSEEAAKAGMRVAPLSFGDGLHGTVFYPLHDGKYPVVIWLHPYAYAAGWSAKRPWSSKQVDFVLDQRPSFEALVQRGFAVMAFDQIGFGVRLHDARRFYERYPNWSLMGKMVADTQSAIEAVSTIEEIDSSRIYLFGYALGAKLALITAALDGKVSAVASVAGFDPLRPSKGDRGVEGVRHYSHLHGLLPKAGFFLGQEERLPIDFDEILALAAPKRVLLVAPSLDRYAPIERVRIGVEHARKIYRLLGRQDALELRSPEDFNRFPIALQEEVIAWLAELP